MLPLRDLQDVGRRRAALRQLLLAVNAVASGVLRIVLALLVAVGVMLAAALWEAEQTAQQAP